MADKARTERVKNYVWVVATGTCHEGMSTVHIFTSKHGAKKEYDRMKNELTNSSNVKKLLEEILDEDVMTVKYGAFYITMYKEELQP